MDPMKDIVASVMQQMSTRGGVSLIAIQQAWERLGEHKGCKVVDFKDGCLTIGADASIRLVKLNMNRDALLKKLQKEFPSIVKLQFKVSAT